jgi:methylenetetrahydrofolate reductase (NADPH)
MRIAELYASDGPVFSLEFYTPKTEAGHRSLWRTLADLKRIEPGFLSVTCGAAGTTREPTANLVIRLEREFGITAMAHMVCTGTTREQLEETLAHLEAEGIENVLALRGDLPEGVDPDAPRDFRHGADLARFVRESDGLCIGGAAHPEMHPESSDWEDEIRHAREKVEAGCEFLVTQLFFDNADFFRYLERARAAGISVPIVPGIMPVDSVPGIKRMAAMNGNRIPAAFLAQLEAAAEDPAAVHALGVRYATAQCEDLLARGVPGIHFFTLNRSTATREILTRLREQGTAPR